MKKSDLIKMRDSITQGEWAIDDVELSNGIVELELATNIISPAWDVAAVWKDAGEDKDEARCNAKAIAALPAILDHAIKLEEEVERLKDAANYVIGCTQHGFDDDNIGPALEMLKELLDD